MTCYDKIKDIVILDILGCIDIISGLIIIICCVIMMVYFFGQEGIITKKVFFPAFLFVILGVVFFSITCFYDCNHLMKMKDEPFSDGIYLASSDKRLVYIGRAFFYLSIISTGFRCFKKKRILNSILLFVCSVIFIEYVVILSSYTLSYIWDNPRKVIFDIFHLGMDKNLHIGAIIIISSLLLQSIILLALYFFFVRKKRTMYIAWKYRIAFIIWEISIFAIHLLPYSPNLSDSEHFRYMEYELGVIVPFVGLVMPFLFVTVISGRYFIEKTRIQENYISAELDYLRQYKKDQNETRAFRHDIINNLSILSTMYAEGKYSEAGNHLSDLLGDIRAMSPKYITGDEMLDCIVGMKISKMEGEGISFTLDGVLDGGLGMKPVDICTIFANAIDNAIEACEKLEEKRDRWIKLSIKRTDRFFSINLCNSMLDDKKQSVVHRLFGGGDRFTTKEDKSLHGYGTQNMQKVISKYDGIEKVNAENGVFTLSIIFPRTN